MSDAAGRRSFAGSAILGGAARIGKCASTLARYRQVTVRFVRAIAVPVALLSPLAVVTGGTSGLRASVDPAPAQGSTSLVPFNESAIPSGRMGDAIRYGQKIVTNTQTYGSQYVGNGLNCTSCHLNGGRTADAGPWVGIWGVFPEYRSRNDAVNALQDRINDCFERSMNGTALPTKSEEMYGILAYMWWLSKDVPTGASVAGRGFRRISAESAPDPLRGREIYETKCASCHMPDGEGKTGPMGEYLFPALWGPKSFNIAAGMARLNNAAAFVKANMPIGQEDTLTVQEAFDVAAYFTQQPRPDFVGKANDWPNGDKPKDARY
jgi:thiosulfate dehydrogenase